MQPWGRWRPWRWRPKTWRVSTLPAREFFQALPREFGPDAGLDASLASLGQRLGQSKRPMLICGTDAVRESTPALAADLVRLLRAAGLNAGLFYLLPGANAFGAALLSPEGEGLAPLVEALETGAVKALVAVESDPCWDYPDRERLNRALEKLELLVALDFLPSAMVARAEIVLPTLTVFERTPTELHQSGGPPATGPAGAPGRQSPGPDQPGIAPAPDLPGPGPRRRSPDAGGDFTGIGCGHVTAGDAASR